jgi:hypothetical protein
MAKKAISLRFDEALLKRVDAEAKSLKSDRTAFLEAAARSLLDDATRAPLDLPRAETEQRVQAVRSQVPGVKTAAEVRADPSRLAAMGRMSKIYGKS